MNHHGRFRASDILRKVFEEVVCGGMTAGLVGGEGFAVDGQRDRGPRPGELGQPLPAGQGR